MKTVLQPAAAIRAVLRPAGAILLAGALGGCKFTVLDPAGDVAAQQRDLLVMSTDLMLLIIVPVLALVAFFAWRYRAANETARYDPEWHHSTRLEVVIWAAPLLIVICLGALTWTGTHILDPYRPIGRIAPGRAVQAQYQPLRVQVVALDWKWLFIYPDLGIASVNDLAAPVDRPIQFQITASSVMNSFYVPALAGQIYAMPGMETTLHAVINRAGDYEGFSANYSGAGFPGMRFAFHGLSDADFAHWVARVKQDGGALNQRAYLALERPSENEPVRHYASVTDTLYHMILNMCVEPGKMCRDDMMRLDAKGGLGLAGIRNVTPLDYDKYARRGAVLGPDAAYVASLCSVPEAIAAGTAVQPAWRSASDATPLTGKGLASPGLLRRADAAPAMLRTAAANAIR